MQTEVLAAKYPELVFGIAGPIGIDIDNITRALQDALKVVAYESCLIKITDEISKIKSSVDKPLNESFYNLMRYKMAHASAICRENNDPAHLMRIAMSAIARTRPSLREATTSLKNLDDSERSVVSAVEPGVTGSFNRLITKTYSPAFRTAYVIRQIKRPEEVGLLRRVYGRQFILVSAYGTEDERARILREKIRQTHRISMTDAREKFLANELVELDMNEGIDKFGQHTRDAFYLADVVIDGISRTKMASDLERFMNALFGLNEVAPTKAEYGMSAAYNAALRSSDLSRQVGAAVLSDEGGVLAQGCNEVPRAFGGTYWDGEEPDYRDVKIGKDSNDILKVDVLLDLIETMKKRGLLAEKILKAGSPAKIVSFLLGRSEGPAEFAEIKGALKSTKILDLTEYGRVVHAEMNCICDSARNGVPLRGGTLYTTTFPCHNCTKHIIAAGISEVRFLAPYPKSKAKELHDNEIEIEGDAVGKVNFKAFTGITPFRYRDLFSKGKRKRDGIAVKWQHGGPAPMVDVFTPDYLRLESIAKTPEERTPSPARRKRAAPRSDPS